MDQHDNPNHWRQMFGNGRRDQPPERNGASPGLPPSDGQRAQGGPNPFAYDDGYDPARDADATRQHPPLSPEDMTDEAAMALALDAQEYRPWILQRGARPVMMLHLRRYEPKSGLWMGWQVSYPSLIAVEYVGDKMLSLDFGTRHFVIEGTGLDKLSRYLQHGSVLALSEYSEKVWPFCETTERITLIGHITQPK